MLDAHLDQGGLEEPGPDEHERRWRLALGTDQPLGGGCLSDRDLRMSAALDALYDDSGAKKAGLESSAPRVARWLGDIREFFPAPVVQVLEANGIPVVRLADGKADRSEDTGVRVATMHRSKGLEFDTIFLCCLGASDVPPQLVLASAIDAAGRRQAIERERSLIHVAATRAKRRLSVSWSGEPSELLAGARP